MKKAINELLKYKLNSLVDLTQAKREIAKKYGISVLKNSDVLRHYHDDVKGGLRKSSPILEKLLRKRAVRTMSGIAPVAVLTKPFACPGKCAYCPTESDVPQSYLSNEPAVMRAIHCGYNPYKQVQLRLQALEVNGHEPTKIELIVIGGTWSVLPDNYKYWYIKECFRAANEYKTNQESGIRNYGKNKNHNSKFIIHNSIKVLKEQLIKEQKRNEKAKYKIIGLTLETRPDYVNEKELVQMRELGCTRVELGVQAIDDKILKLNKRGHGVEAIAAATKILKDFGFKVTYHLMPALPGATPAKDLKMFAQLFSDSRFQPDQIKFYPTVVTKGSLLHRWWKAGKYKPYTNKALQKLIIDCKKLVPEYVRIIRLIRDIPEQSILAGNRITNLRQIMQDAGAVCRCIRCREAKEKQLTINNLQLTILKYKASKGEEYFIQAESRDKKILYGFCRLRLSEASMPFAKTALIRELHVYGQLVSVGQESKTQHAGLGKQLMAEAERIAVSSGFKQIAVISGVGVRGYYKKLGYKLAKTYLVKKLN